MFSPNKQLYSAHLRQIHPPLFSPRPGPTPFNLVLIDLNLKINVKE